jgi:site-specific recombinase XerD
LLLLDTGIRAEELCSLRIHEVDLRNRRVQVFGKGSKQRVLPISSRTGKAIWVYLQQRGQDSVGDYLFVTKERAKMDRTRLYHQLEAIEHEPMWWM